jgi:hypothetical protein
MDNESYWCLLLTQNAKVWRRDQRRDPRNPYSQAGSGVIPRLNQDFDHPYTPRFKPPTASPAPSTSLSSPSSRLRSSGLKTGLAKPPAGRRIGLDDILVFVYRVDLPFVKEDEKELLTVGEDATELAAEFGIDIGMEMGIREEGPEPRGLRIGEMIEG